MGEPRDHTQRGDEFPHDGVADDGSIPLSEGPVELPPPPEPLPPDPSAHAVPDPGAIPPVWDLNCRWCGMLLESGGPGAVCPACGGVQLGEQDGAPQIVADARPCLVCHYNLQGLPASGVCPECGTPVADSLRGNLLRYSPLPFLRTLRAGISLAFWSVVALVVLRCIEFVTGIFTAATAAFGWAALSQAVFEGLSLIVSGLSLYAWWLFSTPDPALLGQDRAEKARRWLRVGVVAVAGSTLASFLLTTAQAAGLLPTVVPVAPGPGVPPPALPFWPLVIGGAIGLAGFAAWGVQFFATMLYLRHMAMRMLDLELFRMARRNIWLLPLLYIVGAVFCGIGPLIALVLYLVMLWGVRERLSRVLEEARALAEGRPLPADPGPPA